jgi:hypothetical protein
MQCTKRAPTETNKMTHIELSRLCRLIFAVVAEWLSRQDETTRFIHRYLVETIQTSCDASVNLVLEMIREECPPEGQHYLDDELPLRFDELPLRVKDLLSAEFQELSKLFTALYEEFKVRFFGGDLPACVVKVFHNLALPEGPVDPEAVCRNEIGPGWLALMYNGWPEHMITRLLHQMAHISTDIGHGLEWRSEISRIRQTGAPTDEDVERLGRMGWTNISASPWLPC